MCKSTLKLFFCQRHPVFPKNQWCEDPGQWNVLTVPLKISNIGYIMKEISEILQIGPLFKVFSGRLVTKKS